MKLCIQRLRKRTRKFVPISWNTNGNEFIFFLLLANYYARLCKFIAQGLCFVNNVWMLLLLVNDAALNSNTVNVIQSLQSFRYYFFSSFAFSLSSSVSGWEWFISKIMFLLFLYRAARCVYIVYFIICNTPNTKAISMPSHTYTEDILHAKIIIIMYA